MNPKPATSLLRSFSGRRYRGRWHCARWMRREPSRDGLDVTLIRRVGRACQHPNIYRAVGVLDRHDEVADRWKRGVDQTKYRLNSHQSTAETVVMAAWIAVSDAMMVVFNDWLVIRLVLAIPLLTACTIG